MQNVQKAFVDFFQAEQHTMIKSSSVLPWNDPSLAFVNAGMNQVSNHFASYLELFSFC